jgi:hypothetical protein
MTSVVKVLGPIFHNRLQIGQDDKMDRGEISVVFLKQHVHGTACVRWRHSSFTPAHFFSGHMGLRPLERKK